jgi:hypothetical protein
MELFYDSKTDTIKLIDANVNFLDHYHVKVELDEEISILVTNYAELMRIYTNLEYIGEL